MIKNIWSLISIYCGNHDEDTSIELVPHAGNDNMGMFYSCPKYYNENRDEHELACANRLNLVEYEEMVSYISKLIESQISREVNLAGHRWKNKKGTEFYIFSHDSKGIKVTVLNKKAVR